MLAHVLSDEDSVREFVARHGPLEKRTRNTLVSARALADDLRLTRERGYVLDREESELGRELHRLPAVPRLGDAAHPAA